MRIVDNNQIKKVKSLKPLVDYGSSPDVKTIRKRTSLRYSLAGDIEREKSLEHEMLLPLSPIQHHPLTSELNESIAILDAKEQEELSFENLENAIAVVAEADPFGLIASYKAWNSSAPAPIPKGPESDERCDSLSSLTNHSDSDSLDSFDFLQAPGYIPPTETKPVIQSRVKGKKPPKKLVVRSTRITRNRAAKK